METYISNQRQSRYYYQTKLDTGCSGLCVKTPKINQACFRIQQTFTCLVYGTVPIEWNDDGVQVVLPSI